MSDNARPRAHRPAIAIVDDDASVRVSLRRLCHAFGYSAIAYASGPEFIAALERDPSGTDCLILDTHMPQMSGIELQRHLIANGVRIPTIVVTADEASDAPLHYATSSITAYLIKPISCEDLLAAIARAVRTPESRVG